SSNGTFVNKRRMRGELELADGDAIQVGPQLFSISIEREPEEENDSDVNVLDDGNMKSPSDSKTIIGKVEVIDPDNLESGERGQLDDRLKDL
ncbi:MAG: FHA domain-containing protein, partial [Planctomycetales bacterium]